jgi:hypothetical protein
MGRSRRPAHPGRTAAGDAHHPLVSELPGRPLRLVGHGASVPELASRLAAGARATGRLAATTGGPRGRPIRPQYGTEPWKEP